MCLERGNIELYSIDEALIQRRKIFEDTKYNATGKGKIFYKVGKKVPSELTKECISACLKMGLIMKNEKKKNSFAITREGKRILDFKPNNQFNNRFKKECLLFYLKTYSDCISLIEILEKNEKKELDLPDTRSRGHITSEQIEKLIGLKIDIVSLRNLIYVLDQNQLINFILVKQENDVNIIRTYLTCKIYKNTFTNKDKNINEHNLLIIINNTIFFIEINEISQEKFEEVVWSEYLNLTDNYEDLPVYYWDLRSSVCYRLKISDQKFDEQLRILEKVSNKYKMGWSAGHVPAHITNANSIKNVPPKIDNEYYMVYVSFDRRLK